ncbi:hypothetical protein PULV_b0565 [Pseudoalteromonas ulvae UL12]|nr:hypothetical protein [Pseudoalteromonas ulvae UL12]
MNAHQKYYIVKQTDSEPLNWKIVNEILDKYPNDLNWIGSLVLYKSQGIYSK